MTKKPEKKSFISRLSDLLFEETESINLNGIEEPSEPAAKPAPAPAPAPAAPVQTAPAAPVETPVREEPKPEPIETVQVVPAAKPAPAPAPERPRTTMQRIDLTQSVDLSEVRQPQQRRQPQQPQQNTESVFRVAGEQRRKAQPRPEKKDDQRSKKNAQQTARPSKAPAEKKPARSVYEFQPVISPMFGVNEKDLDALKTTTSKLNEAEKEKVKKTGIVTTIISPIYGSDQESSPVMMRRPAEQPNPAEQAANTDKPQAEDEIPDFSLDDILRAGDEQYANRSQADNLEDTAPLFADTDDTDDGDDDTMLISRAEYERLRRGGNG